MKEKYLIEEKENQVAFMYNEKEFTINDARASIFLFTSKQLDELLESDEISQECYDDVSEYMREYISSIYISAYTNEMGVLVDGYNEEEDKASGSPWCTQYITFHDVSMNDASSYAYLEVVNGDALEVAGFIDEEESNLGHDSVFYITLNCGERYSDYVCYKKVVAKKGRNYQKIYTTLSLECAPLKKAGHSYFIDTELIERIDIQEEMNTDIVVDICNESDDPDLYAASYALHALDSSKEEYSEIGIEYHLDCFKSFGADFDTLEAQILAENLANLR